MSVASSEVLIFDSQLLQERDYWKERLSGITAASSLPPDYDVARDHSQKSIIKLQLPQSLIQAVEELTSGSPFLIYTTFLAAAKICLHRYSEGQTIIVGSPALKELGRANSLAIVSEVTAEMTFRQLLMNLRETLLEAYEKQSYPFDYLMRDLEVESQNGRGCFFDLVVTLKDLHGEMSESSNGVTVAIEKELDQLSGYIEFDPSLYGRDTIVVFANHLVTVLEAALKNRDKRIGDLEMMTVTERRQLLVDWNATATAYPRDKCINDLFEEQVRRNPEAVALLFGAEEISYSELNRRANKLAHYLCNLGVGPETVVGLCVERSVEMVVGLLGILKAGGAYLPLDPQYPLKRLHFMLEDTAAPVLLTQERLLASLPTYWSQVVCLDTEWDLISQESEDDLRVPVSAENLAYVMYTSGSTGTPKGVSVVQRNVVRLVKETNYAEFGREQVFLQMAPLSFDASTFELWGSLLNGAKLVIMAPGTPALAELGAVLQRYEVSTLWLTAGLFHLMVSEGVEQLRGVRQLLAGGDVLSVAQVRKVLAGLEEGSSLINGYGPTEGTTFSCCYAMQKDTPIGATVPIGSAIGNTEVYVLDQLLQPAPVGVAGELYIGGDGLARGYWQQAELTAERFVPHPFTAVAGSRLYRTGDIVRYRADGQIQFLGRMDHQVKVRGFRIELGEIEEVLKQHPAIQDAAVIIRKDQPGDKRLVAYLVPRQMPAPGINELLDFLKQKLPDFMMPQAFVTLDQLPLNPSGKIDRPMLPPPDYDRPDLEDEFVEPAGEVEQLLARVWKEVLRVEQIGRHDNFFALGGESILAIQVVARANQAGVSVQTRHLFEHQTIAELALVAGTAPAVEAEQGQVSGPVPLTPIQYWFFGQDLPEPHHFNQSVILETEELLNQELLKSVFDELLRHHDALRLRYSKDAAQWQQFNSDFDGASVQYFDFSTLPQAELSPTIEQHADALQASLNLTDGPLMRIAWFDCGPDNPARLLLVVHHLVVDGVSWRIILNDLQTGYGQALRGEPITFGPKTTSFKYWAERLATYSSAGALDAEKEYWRKFAQVNAPSLPVDQERGVNTVEWARRVYVSLDADETRALLQEVPAAYNTQINDVLLTALLQAFHDWTGERSLLITLEGHGREEIIENVDLSRTVGWFTTEYPVFLTLGETQSEGESLCLVKEQLRAIPQRGIGYGLLRYLSDDSETSSQLGQLAQPEFSFNYLGQFDQVLSESSLFRIARESRGQTQSRHGKLPHLLQVNGSVAGGRLQLALIYSEKVFQPATIESFGESFQRSLRALISHCQSPEAGGFTPSDFPLASLTQAELDLVARSDKHVEDIYPLTPFQHGLLFHALYAPGSDVYFMQLSATIEEQQVDIDGFRRSWQRVVDRNATLRTAFVWEGVREALQVVRQRVTLPWQELDWREFSATEQKERLDVFLKNDERRGFVLSEAPLMRCTLIRLGEDTYRFVWSVHHLLLDGWSMMHVIKELFDFYDAFAAGKELSPSRSRPFRDYIAWLQQQDEGKAETFWRTALTGFTSPNPIEVTRQNSNQQAKEEYFDLRWTLSLETTEGLKEFARRYHLTLNTIVQGMFGLLLGRYSNSDDVVYGATVAGRPGALLGVESMVGVFLNTLPVRVRNSRHDTLVPWLEQLQEQQAEAQQFEYTPLVQVQAWSEVPRGRPLFETILIFENYPTDESLKQRREGLLLKDVSSIDRANYPLAVGASPGRQLHFRFSYDRRVYEDETITRMFGHLQTLLEAVLANPEQRLVDLPLLTDAEQQQLLVEWNQTATPSFPQLCLHELFEAQVRRLPESMALWTPEAHLSYAELNKRANQLAHFLREQSVGPEVYVGICMERSWEMVVSMLAVMKAGGAYVPLDPEYPLERLRYMMEEINAWVVLTQGHVADRLPAHWGQVICVDDEWENFTSFPDENPVSGVTSENLANLIFTSGSTGTPKAAMVTHYGLCNTILHRTEALSLTHEDRFLQTNSFSFDASVWEFFAPLATGSELVMLRPGGYQDPNYVVEMLAQHRITVVEFPPSWLRMVLQEPGLDRCVDLKHVICGGQILTGELQETFYSRVNAQLHNYYGPTEASIDATGWTCQREMETRTAPIGHPISNVQVYILDDLLRPVPIGVSGELHIGGDGVARGYLNQAALTAEKFIPNPFSGAQGTRLYKTGDMARYLANGVIEFCGRNDDQVKIRGFRIELGEVEAALVQHEEVLEAAVIGREDTPGDKRLVAYVVAAADCQPTIDQLRTYLAQTLPDHMVPSSFVTLEKLPRNLNGKVDRERLPAPDLSRPQLETPFVAPRNSMEGMLARIWIEVLGVKQVGIDDNFFALGGDSIRSVQVLSKAQQEGLTFSLQSIFQHQTIRRLAEEIAPVGSEATLQTTPFSLISAADRERLQEDAEDAYPLTMLQAGMIFHTEYKPDTAVYHSISSRRIRGKLDVDALRKAIQRIVEQHSALRTSFHLHGFSEPLQVVHRSVVVPVTEDDLRNLEPAEQDTVMTEWLAAERVRPFDWATAPLLRLHVHRFTDDTFQFTFAGHHSLLDGWSDTIVFSDLLKRYVSLLKGEDELEVAPPGVPYREFVFLERNALESEATRNFWNEKLSDSVVTTLPRWTTRRSDAPLAWVPIPVSGDVSDDLKKITQSTGIPIKDVLLAVHMKVMSLLAGQRDVITGLISNGRPEMTDGERMVGLFLNTLPFRMKLPAGSWLDLAGEVFAAERELLPHRRYPLARIQQDQGGQSLFETAFNFTQFHLYQELRDVSDLEILQSRNVAETNFTLLLDISIGLTNKIHAQLAGNVAELQEEQVAAIAGYYARALEAMANDPYANHDAISLLSEAEQEQQLGAWNAGDTFASELTVVELFEAQVARRPSAVALVCNGEELTYEELNRRANRLGQQLQQLGVGPEQLVGVCVERSLEMVVALLGVMKAGGAYVPLDPAYPQERLAFMVADAGVRVIVAQAEVVERITAPGVTVVCVDAAVEEAASENVRNETSADNTAYVIYTSGSTGQPKGVAITHRNVVRLFAGTERYYEFGAEDVWTLFHSYAFDFSVWEMWGALLYGGKLVVVPYWVSRSPEAFYELLAAEGVTVLNQTPSAFRQLSEVDSRVGAELKLRLVIFGGEALELNALRPWYERHGEAGPQLVNMYGITETTVHVTYRALRTGEIGSQSVIGGALPDLQVYVLDEHLRLLPVGVSGELYVGGAGLGRGYLNRPELTAERFLPDPYSSDGGRLYKTGDLARYLADGDLVYLGRADDQVKIRGFRIELGEIEAALRKHSAVRDVVVHTPTDASGEMRLVAYVVTELEATDAAAELRRHLKERLPAHMVPQGFVVLEQLPVGLTGKLDRRALPTWKEVAFEHDESPDAARLPVEDMLAGIWAEVLGVEHVAVGDNFFDLGGHSLLATQVISRVRETFKTEIPLLTLFEVPRLSDLAAVVEAALRQEQGLSAPPITRESRDIAPLSFAQQRLWIVEQLAKGAAVYHLPVAVRLKGELNVEALERSLNEVVRRHEVLRTSFALVQGNPAQVIAPSLELALPVLDLSELPQTDREAEARRIADEFMAVQFDLTSGPLLRARLLRLDTEEHVALFVMHHIISDGWSMGVLVREIATLYDAFMRERPSPLPELPVQYADFASWQREWLQGDVLESQLNYWKKQLGPHPPELVMPLDHPRPAVQTHNGARSSFAITAEIQHQLNALSRREGVTMFMTLLAAFQTLLYRYSSQEDIVVGTDMANRNRAETENVIGFFVNMLVLRTDLSGNPTFRELLARVREVCLGAYAHQDLPFDSLVDELEPERNPSRNPLFQAVFVLQNTPSSELKLPGITLSPFAFESNNVQFDLILTLVESRNGITGIVSYNTDLFAEATIDTMMDRYQTLLQAIVEDPGQRIADVRLASTELTREDFPRADISQKDFENLLAQLANQTG
jgi:amino acid adenylation domain-containing protein/non-ribosomal peptide synthase protein (TIGR01720 family)